ncbi:hypothetical protein [Amycolatopsis sp. cmx-11-51]
MARQPRSTIERNPRADGYRAGAVPVLGRQMTIGRRDMPRTC